MAKDPKIAALISDVREHLVYLRELGVESMSVALPDVGPVAKEYAARPEDAPGVVPEPAAAPVPRTEPGSRMARLPSLGNRNARPAATGKDAAPTASPVSRPEVVSRPAVGPTPDVPSSDVHSTEEGADSIENIRADIGDCTRCPLCSGRTQIVHTTGNFRSQLMFIGEAPGADEDLQGFPFVGRAGQLLTKIIEGIGFKREEVCIGNINRCRPPGNRAPTLPEAETCKPFLLREIAVVRPKVIVVLGNTATQNLLNTKVGITKLRGEFTDYYGVKVMPTFHPAYLLRDPHKKREVWEDMKKVRDYLITAQ